MVKFGRHQEAFLENEHKGSNLYVVPYRNVRTIISVSLCEEAGGEHFASCHDNAFVKEWRSCLCLASDDFERATRAVWMKVFEGLSMSSESRGAVPNRALQLFVSSVKTIEEVQDLLRDFKEVNSTALVNAEALRKLVKKYDKKSEKRNYHGQSYLSALLLPELYAANFTVGQPTLAAALTVLRDHLGMDDDYDADEENSESMMCHVPNTLHDFDHGEDEEDGHQDEKKDDCNSNERARSSSLLCLGSIKDDSHRRLVDGRKFELEWLRTIVSSIDTVEISHIVAHRGFHSPKDRSDRRPLENSLTAYEAAWTSGIHLCECDVALTKDEKLILAHDEDFSRLALDPSSPLCKRYVRDLTLKELMSIPLKSGSRPPLLVDVLRSAHAIGGDSRLIVEIKPGNTEAGSALVRMFARHPFLINRVEAVMSFDAFAMHTFRKELDLLFEHQPLTRGRPTPVCPHEVCTPRDALVDVDNSSSTDGMNFSSLTCAGQLERDKWAKTKIRRPNLLLLTTSGEPNHKCELFLDVSDLSPVEGWLRGGDGGYLDGVYMQFQREMLEPGGTGAIRELSHGRNGRKFDVGVWGENGRDPDEYTTFHHLVKECGVSYVNSDLPRGFKRSSAQTTRMSSGSSRHISFES